MHFVFSKLEFYKSFILSYIYAKIIFVKTFLIEQIGKCLNVKSTNLKKAFGFLKLEMLSWFKNSKDQRNLTSLGLNSLEEEKESEKEFRKMDKICFFFAWKG